MRKVLEMVSTMIDGANKYEKETGIKNPPIYFSKNNLLIIEKSLKALEIIKKKNVSVWGFRNRVFGYQKKQNGNITINYTYEYYLNNFGCYHNGFDIEPLTEEEFNLLREVLE